MNYNDGQFDPRKRDIVDTEPQFDIAMDEPWAKFKYKMPNGEEAEGQLAIKGTIDLVTKVADDTIEVVDGRPDDDQLGNRRRKTYEKLQDPQLLLYNYAISKLYPDYNQAIDDILYRTAVLLVCVLTKRSRKVLGYVGEKIQTNTKK